MDPGSDVSGLLRFRRILFDRLPHHVVEFAFDFLGVAFVFACDGAPNQGARGGVAKNDHQRAFRIGNPDDACAPAAPTRRVGFGLDLPLPRRERVANVEVGSAGLDESESLGGQEFLDV